MNKKEFYLLVLIAHLCLTACNCFAQSANTIINELGIINEATKAYDNESYYVALSILDELYDKKIDSIPLYTPHFEGVVMYADCLYYTGNIGKALAIYLEWQKRFEKLIEYGTDKHKYTEYDAYLFLQIGRCFYSTKQYGLAIPFLDKAKYYADPWEWTQRTAVICLSDSYYELGEKYKSSYVIDNYIDSYIIEKNYKLSDCWTKGYKDELIAEMFYCRYFNTDSDNDKKYLIISAKWGNKDAIEKCKQKGISYNTKPFVYEY